MEKKNRGFTLVEMLVVIAIVAVLVAIVLPTVRSGVTRANAATDGANLRNILGQANTLLVSCSDEETFDSLRTITPKSQSFPDAEMYLVNNYPAFIGIYYVDGDHYYGTDYFSAVAQNGSASGISTAKPTGANYADDLWVNLSSAS